ncbi:MFS transporter [Francisella tularensis subsp. novicida]|uniref:MFS transporter n=1 Tax=Francisella tularensis TaxID=263 RepID=UPI0008FD1D08|nr:MFS transporter [Francisella tularensis]APC94404.1 sugar (and other) transporter family protein [Francisella tularensis subsp. novicida]MBK2345661.1 MFS transporter [Francisella tularensis subsp. novicida]
MRIKSVIISSIGSTFETFDFHIFGLFALQISMSLLHKDSFNSSLILIFAIFGAGYFARPLGAIFWGNLGDKYGRTVPFKWTVILIGVASLVIAVLPSSSVIGIFSPLILAACRLIQGFSFGGELIAAVLLVYEQPAKSRSFYTSVVIFCATFGMILASIVYYLLSLVLTTEQFFAFSWRLAFAFGGIAVLVSYFWRASIQETLVTEFTGKRGFVALELLKTNIRLLLRCVLTAAATVIFLSMFIVFLPTFCQKGLGFDKVTTSVYVLVIIVTYAVSALAGGYLGDIIGNKKTQALGIILAIIILIPLAISLLVKSAVALLFIVLFAIVNGFINANYMIVVLNRFDKLQRFSGLAITQNISMAIFMGVLPALFAFLVADLKILSAPFYILFVLYIVALMSLFD